MIICSWWGKHKLSVVVGDCVVSTLKIFIYIQNKYIFNSILLISRNSRTKENKYVSEKHW